MLKKYSYSQRVKNVLRRATYFLGGQLPEFALIYCPQLLEPARSLHLYRRHYRGGAFPWRLLFEQHTCQPSPKLRFFRQFPSVLCRPPPGKHFNWQPWQKRHPRARPRHLVATVCGKGKLLASCAANALCGQPQHAHLYTYNKHKATWVHNV